MARTKKDVLKLPNMNEFSPSVVGELGPLLQVVKANQGNKAPLVQAISQASPTIVPRPNEQHLNRANNVLIGMSQCGLFDLETSMLTDLGNTLVLEVDDAKRYERFSSHLLKRCRGEELFDAIRSLTVKREPRTGENIRDELKRRGFTVTTNEGNASKIRLWLERSGVIDEQWNIDEDRYRALAGIRAGTREDWRLLTPSQRAFLLTLRQVTAGKTPRWISGPHVKELCVAQWGPKALPEGDLRKKVIEPLENSKWLESRGKGTGRGGKLGEVRASEKLLEIEAELGIEHRIEGIPRDLLKKLDTPLDEIYRDLESGNVSRKGLALELLCLRLCFGLGLRPVAFRKRGEKTKGAEVDLIADGVHLHYSRWMFQCKNTPAKAVDLEDLAKEIGLAVLLKAHVIVLATTGRFARSVPRYADGVASETHLQVVLVDGGLLKRMREEGESRLVESLKEQAREALAIKAPQVLEVLIQTEGA